MVEAAIPGLAIAKISNGLAGYLIEAQTGLTLAEYSKANLFKSLGMNRGMYSKAASVMKKIAIKLMEL
jgi:hypothetical protein